MAPVEPGPAPDPDGSGSGGGSGGSGPGQVCGNGIVEGTEECDDGNLISGDGCSSTCQIEPGICRECQCTFGEPVCGNGLLETGEQCDDGNNEDGDGCSSTCQWEEYCGDGIIQPGLGEVCDSGVGCGGLPGPRVCADDCTECLCAPFLCVPGTIPDMATCTCVPAPCTQDSDCGDPDQCSQCNLASGVCEPKPDGALCEDGDLCTMDTCSAGFCLPDTAVTCDDGNPCTSDSCDPDVGCVHEPLTGTPCNDGNACTQTDICQAGVCTGTDPVVCTALDQCHDAGVCDPGTGVCSNPVKPLGTPCDIDGQPDTCCEWEICLNGNCIADGVVCSGFQTCDETPGPTCGQCI